MYPVSNEFKAAVYAPIRTTKGRVTFDISDVTAPNDVNNISTTQEFILSNKQQLVNKKRTQSYNLATWELNRFKLDGSFCFADDNIPNNKEIGYCSKDLCGEDGAFTPYQDLLFTFNSNHSSMGITVTFDTVNNEYATDFTIIAYNANSSVIATEEITNNEKAQVSFISQIYEYRKIGITIKKWCKPFRRCRICEVDFGITRVYEDNGLINMSLIEQLDLTTNLIPSSEFRFTVDNANREFNILNPEGFYKFLQERQQVIAELGIEVGATTEYVQLGNYLLLDWTSDEGALTASFTARTNLDLMSGFDYENLAAKSNYSLYQMAVDIFTTCGITNYEIDVALQTILTNALIKKINCKNALQMIAIAGCANIFVSRNNVIKVTTSPSTVDNAVDCMDLDNIYQEPQIELDKIVKAVEVTYYNNLDTKQVVRVDNANVSIGDTLKLESNTLINTPTQATNVANWILRQKNYRAIYTSNWRGNPAHELNDIVTIEDGYEQNNNAFITKNELDYEGYLRGKTELRGMVL